MELVGAGLGDDVDDAARRTAVLGVVAAGDDLGLLDELVGQVGRQQAEARVGRVDALDDVRVLDRGRAAQRRAVEVVLRPAAAPSTAPNVRPVGMFSV